MSQVPASDDPPEPAPTPGWEAVTAFVEWDQALPTGTQLRDYEIRSVIGESAYGIVYLAWDHALRRRVAIKEYLPRALATRTHAAPTIALKKGASAAAFNVGLKGFVAEARMLARFDHPALVKIYRFWEDNGTAYRVTPYYEGPTLERVLADQVQEEAEVRTWLRPVLDAVGVMHAARCFHHHIAPGNILVTASGPVLLDFAAARRLVGSLNATPAGVASAGYAPIEQYSEAATVAPGPWTDLYALAAICYRALRAEPPPPAPERLINDRYKPLREVAAERCGEGFVEAIDAALAVEPDKRPRNDAEFRALMGGIEAPLPQLPIGALRDLMAEPFTQHETAAARQVTVPIPTQPYPSILPEEPHPMDEPFLSAPMPPPAPAAREEAGLSRRVTMSIGLGVCALGIVAALVLHRYAGRTPTEAQAEAAASAAAGAASASAPVVPLQATPAATPMQAPAPAAASPGADPASASAVRRIPVESPPVDEADRHARCTDLLQEATLRELSVAEAAFFKKECR